MKQVHISTVAFALSAFVSVGLASSAYAAPAGDYTMILIDVTGSMTGPGADAATPKLDYAINKANAALANAYSGSDGWTPKIERGISIWFFRRDNTGATTDKFGAYQVWPDPSLSATDATAVCKAAGGVSLESFAGTTNPPADPASFCRFPSTSDYAGLTDPGAVLLGTILPLAKVNIDRADTPLAKSLCQAVTETALAGTGNQKTIVLESDGGENSTPLTDVCGGAFADIPDGFAPVTTSLDWGYPLASDGTVSWEAKVIRRGIQVDITDPTAWTSTPKSGLMHNLAWKVTALFDLYPPTAAPLAMTSLAATLAVNPAPATLDVPLARLFAAPMAATATPSTSPTYSIDLGELALMKGLGKSNARSRYSEIVLNTANPVKYGSVHKVPGDVDNSGCVDMADYNQIKQKDVWLQMAVAPLQIAILADLNADGWVNGLDSAIVIANWGKGNGPGGKCKYPVGPAPKK